MNQTILSLHGVTLMHSNLVSDIRITRESGFDGYVVPLEKLMRYIDWVGDLEGLKATFKRYQIRPLCIDGIEITQPDDDQETTDFIQRVEVICKLAETLGINRIQLITTDDLENYPWNLILERTAARVARLAKIGERYGIFMLLEPTAWSPVHSLWQSLAVLDAAGCVNLGLALDFWQLWAGGETHPNEILKLKLNQIYGVHLSDGKKPAIPGEGLKDAELRSWLPGSGNIPIKEWVNALHLIGYDGWWAAKLYSPRHWEWDYNELAITCHRLLVESLR